MQHFDYLKINLASPKKIAKWGTRTLSDGSVVGEVSTHDTIHYRSLDPVKCGLFCDRIFGTLQNLQCTCGKYKGPYHRGKICEKCKVQVDYSTGRRRNLGRITLQTPVTHIWYLLGRPSYMATMLAMNLNSLVSVVYFTQYVVLQPDLEHPEEDRKLHYKQVISPHQWVAFLKDNYQTKAEISKGAGAIEKLLDINWNEILKNLKRQLVHARPHIATIHDVALNSSNKNDEYDSTISHNRYRELLKQVKIVTYFQRAKQDPKWMILTIVPVIPPLARPMTRSQRLLISHDLNDLYRILLLRNNRLADSIKNYMPTLLIDGDRVLVQEAVDSLMHNGRRGTPSTGSSGIPLKSLSDILKGKEGRFRKTLLGKRVDYSGRSVIVVGPNMCHYNCGLPKDMAIELFHAFVIHYLSHDKRISSFSQARQILDTRPSHVWTFVARAILGHPILLNRAPSLHRLNIQSFLPTMVDDQALHLHPLVCQGYNADFDGDQMGVHIPLSLEAQFESLNLLPVRNYWWPGTGAPALSATQDIVVGTRYLTDKIPRRQSVNPYYFSDFDEVLAAYYNSIINLHTVVWVRRNPSQMLSLGLDSTIWSQSSYHAFVKVQFGSQLLYCHPSIRMKSSTKKDSNTMYFSTTPGRILLNQAFELTSADNC